MTKKQKTTQMRYQVESSHGIHESHFYSLKAARKLKNALSLKLPNVKIYRYDNSNYSNYYEVVE